MRQRGHRDLERHAAGILRLHRLTFPCTSYKNLGESARKVCSSTRSGIRLVGIRFLRGKLWYRALVELILKEHPATWGIEARRVHHPYRGLRSTRHNLPNRCHGSSWLSLRFLVISLRLEVFLYGGPWYHSGSMTINTEWSKHRIQVVPILERKSIGYTRLSLDNRIWEWPHVTRHLPLKFFMYLFLQLLCIQIISLQLAIIYWLIINIV